MRNLKKLLIAGLLLLGVNTGIQAQENKIGTIEDVYQSEGYLLINDTEYSFRQDQILITYMEKQLSTSYLQPGYRVRYQTNKDNVVISVILLGPESELQHIFNQ